MSVIKQPKQKGLGSLGKFEADIHAVKHSPCPSCGRAPTFHVAHLGEVLGKREVRDSHCVCGAPSPEVQVERRAFDVAAMQNFIPFHARLSLWLGKIVSSFAKSL